MGVEHREVLSQLYLLRDFQSKRSSSWDRSGGNRDWVVIAPGKTQVVLDENSAGCVKHFYWTYIEQEEAARLACFNFPENFPNSLQPYARIFSLPNALICK